MKSWEIEPACSLPTTRLLLSPRIHLSKPARSGLGRGGIGGAWQGEDLISWTPVQSHSILAEQPPRHLRSHLCMPHNVQVWSNHFQVGATVKFFITKLWKTISYLGVSVCWQRNRPKKRLLPQRWKKTCLNISVCCSINVIPQHFGEISFIHFLVEKISVALMSTRCYFLAWPSPKGIKSAP